MKSDVMPSIVQMDADVLKNLLTEVKETVANVVELPEAKKSSFGIVDMWKIRRGSKSANSMRSR